MGYSTLTFEKQGRVGVITLDRPEALNALNAQVLDEMLEVLAKCETDKKIGALLVTGSEKAFAAGADIKEMAPLSYMDTYLQDYLAKWDRFANYRKPIVGAVSGYALGGGCELAMMCDVLLASESAKFGQPEITLGIMPGIGGTQRLVRAVGKAKAMEMVLTGRLIGAEEAESAGLVSRVVPGKDLPEEALKVASTIASQSLPVAMMAKESVNRAFEVGLQEGILFERRVFHAMFGMEDQAEGMNAFVEKRSPQFKNR